MLIFDGDIHISFQGTNQYDGSLREYVGEMYCTDFLWMFFVMLHIGQILLFKRAKELGDYLIVAVQDGDYIKKYKPQAEMVYTTEERAFMVSCIKYVDEVIIY